MGPRVGEGGPGAVAEAHQVHLRVAEGGSDGVEVADEVGRAVLRQVGLEGASALARLPARLGRDELRVAIRTADLGAGEQPGAPGSPLIDEDDVALPLEPLEGRGDPRIDLGDRLPRTAGQDEHGVGLRLGGVGRDHRDPQPDLPAVWPGRVLRDLQRPASRRDPGRGDGVRKLAAGEGNARAGRGGQGGSGAGQEDPGEEGETTVMAASGSRRGAMVSACRG